MYSKAFFVFIKLSVLTILTIILVENIVYSANKRNAIIVLKIGEVLIRRADKEKWQPAEIGDKLFEKSSVKTLLHSKTVIRFDNGAMVKLAPLTILTLNELSFRKDINTAVLDIKVGRLWTRAEKLNLKNESFYVKTPTASAGIRGTYFSTKVKDNSATIIDVYEGKIDVSRRDKPSVKVSVSENQRTFIEIGENPTSPVLIPEKELEEGKREFPEDLYEKCKYDIQINIVPKIVKVGEIAIVEIQLLKDGRKYDGSVLFKVSLGGSAKFVDNMSQYIEVMSDKSGYVKLRVMDESAEKIKVNVDVQLEIKK